MNTTPTSTKDKILRAARTLFVAKGFAGTSMGQIAKLAGVNHSLLFHHFGNKAQLWIAVKQSIAHDSQQRSKVLPSTDLTLEAFIARLIHNSFQFYRDHPDIVRMINWQRLESNDSDNIGVTRSEESQAWLQAIQHYQNNGEICSKLKSEYILTLILAITSSAALDPNIFIADEHDLKAYLDACIMRLTVMLKSTD